MSGFSGHRRAIVDIAFATFGEPAAWSGQLSTVTVRFRAADADDRFGDVQLVRRTKIVRVRSWELTPNEGDTVEIAAGPYAGKYKLQRGAKLDGKGVWDCPVVDAA